MGVEIDVFIDFSGVEKIVSPETRQNANLLLIEMASQDSNMYVPQASGSLYGSMKMLSDGFSWDMPYASRVYNRDSLKSKCAAGGTGKPHWFEYACSKHLHEWEQALSDYVANGGTRVN